MWHSTKHIWLLLYKSGLYGIDTFLISSQQIWNVRSQTASDQTISDCIVGRGRKTNFSGQGQKCKEFWSSPIECIRVLFSKQAVVMLWWRNAWQKGLPVWSPVQCIVRSPHWQYFTRVYIIHVSTDATVNPIFAVRSLEISCQTETEFNLD